MRHSFIVRAIALALGLTAAVAARARASVCPETVESSILSGFLLAEEHLGTSYGFTWWQPVWNVFTIESAVGYYWMEDGSIMKFPCSTITF